MLSHQPEVSQLLHREHVQRLADDAQHSLRVDARPAPRPAGVLPRPALPARAALAVKHRRLPTRT
jgi:hypothetical protein